MPWVHDVLVFWFTELDPKQWFNGGPAVDQMIAERFTRLHGEVTALPDATLLRDADTALAAVIVLDQFSRNLFRGTPQAFASDAKALRLADAAIAKGYDLSVSEDGRTFFYLPFEHSEDGRDQKRSVELISALGNQEYTRYALAHRAVIERFGRFPHRNAILGRASSAAEIDFLKQPGSAF